MKINGYYFDNSSIKHTCPQCGQKTFTLFRNDKGDYLPSDYGRCDRENKCGYYLGIKEYFDHIGEQITYTNETGTNEGKTKYYTIPDIRVKEFKEKNYFNPEYYLSKKDYLTLLDGQNNDAVTIRNHFVDYINKTFNLSVNDIKTNMDKYNVFIRLNNTLTILPSINKEFKRYKVEDSNYYFHLHSEYHRNVYFNTVFMYQNIFGEYVTGREFIYLNDFHRDKESERLIHLDYNDYSTDKKIKWCLFGEHLLKTSTDKDVIIVESEKTCFVMSMLYPQFTWLSTGGINGINKELSFFNSNLIYYFIPDSDKDFKGVYCSDKWKQKISNSIFKNSIYQVIEFQDYCTPEQQEKGFDILDLYEVKPDKVTDIINNLNYFKKYQINY